MHNLLRRIRAFKNWWRFVPPFNRKRYGVVAELYDGTKILLRDIRGNDYSTLLAIAGDDSYKFSEIKNPSVIVDVGASIGDFSLLAARRFPQATVYAIEPDPENYKQLLKNIALNNYPNIVPMNVAVGAGYGEAELFQSPNNVAHSIVDSQVGTKAEKVKTIPLSEFPHIDALKFDAEGAEYLLKEIPDVSYIAIEVHKLPGMPMEELLATIRSKFHGVKEEVEKTGHSTFVGVKLL